MTTLYIIREIFKDSAGNSIGIFPVGKFMIEADRDKAWDRYFVSQNRAGIRERKNDEF